MVEYNMSPDIWQKIKKRYDQYGGQVSLPMLRSWFDELVGEPTPYSSATPQGSPRVSQQVFEQKAGQTEAGIKNWQEAELKKIEERLQSQSEALQKNITGKYTHSWQPDTGNIESLANEMRGYGEQLRPWAEQANIYRSGVDILNRAIATQTELERLSGTRDNPESEEEYMAKENELTGLYDELKPYGFSGSDLRSWYQQFASDVENWNKRWLSEGAPIEQKLMSLQEDYARAGAELSGQQAGAISEQQRLAGLAGQELTSGQMALEQKAMEERKTLGAQAQARQSGIKKQLTTQMEVEEKRKQQRTLRYRR